MVSFHAHPDDEAFLTGGTLARLSAEGHRTVLVVATAGEAGLATSAAGPPHELAGRREAEARRSAGLLGCARVEVLGYPDCGYDAARDVPGAFGDPTLGFGGAGVEEPAVRLAEILREEAADVLTIYDPVGGYGHRDHVQVHHVGLRAAELAGTPVVLEATVDRTWLHRAASVLARLPRLSGIVPPGALEDAYTARARLTHRVDVRGHTREKRAAMAAHASQAGADTGVRTLGVLLRLPGPVFRTVCGHEWYVERGRAPSRPLLDDVFATLREDAAQPGHSRNP